MQRHLKPGGRILFYVYRKKGPIREFTDDYVRELTDAGVDVVIAGVPAVVALETADARSEVGR